MVDTKIVNLTLKSPVVSTDELVINDVAGANVDKKVTADGIVAYNDARTKTLTNTTLNLTNNTLNDTSITRGDIIEADATPKFVRRALGAASTRLRSDGTDALWSHPVVSLQTTTYSAVLNDDVILAGGTTAYTITLPTAASISGKIFTIKKTGTTIQTPITIATTSGQTIDAVTSYILENAFDHVIVVSDNSNWVIINKSVSGMLDYRVKGTTINRWHGSATMCGATVTGAIGANTLRASAFILPKTLTFDQIQAEVTAIGAVGTTFRLGIYRDNGNGYPSALIAGSDVGTLAADTNGVKTNTFVSTITLQPGLYWLAYVSDGAPTTRNWSGSLIPHVLGYTSTMGASNLGTNYTVAFTYAALPDPFTAGGTVQTASTNNMIIILLRSIT